MPLIKKSYFLIMPSCNKAYFSRERLICSNVNSLQLRTDNGAIKSHIFISWLVEVYTFTEKKLSWICFKLNLERDQTKFITYSKKEIIQT